MICHKMQEQGIILPTGFKIEHLILKNATLSEHLE